MFRKTMEDTDSPTGKPVKISLGVTESKATDTTPEQIIAQADAVLYQSKRTGRNKTTIYQDQMSL